MAKDKELKKAPIMAVGRRKTATARIFMYEGKGEILVNEVDIDKYFSSDVEKLAWSQPFHLVGVSHPASKFNATIKVRGSGRVGQLGAVVHALSRALATLSEENQVILRRSGHLTRDPRMVERKKYFLKKARKRPQYSKR
ncbi:30S ribosomal protein S9 [candidate division WWE3 bacterium RIFCSPHIGHO2_01_FULL_42_13]|uniref:Small ribosomal subunit protein uS9 n=1 Tax=candidate division WWE3 bacterium RIFCSPHIGHO2_01_FULL_42_13 TaxID=1802617 RepID=A0A1F4UQP5_UNCKA|nr:MAG: 30S ribosomal protein S9 [candidate division WWE3 bacterium RIFCSPHIGHO2_01_FULL_42_13]